MELTSFIKYGFILPFREKVNNNTYFGKYVFACVILGIEPKASCILCKHSTIEQHPQSWGNIMEK